MLWDLYYKFSMDISFLVYWSGFPLARTNSKLRDTQIYTLKFYQNCKYFLEILHKKSFRVYWLNIVGASLLSGQQLRSSLPLYVPSPMRCWTEVKFYLRESFELVCFSLKICILWFSFFHFFLFLIIFYNRHLLFM